jgi:hypothetical protein
MSSTSYVICTEILRLQFSDGVLRKDELISDWPLRYSNSKLTQYYHRNIKLTTTARQTDIAKHPQSSSEHKTLHSAVTNVAVYVKVTLQVWSN